MEEVERPVAFLQRYIHSVHSVMLVGDKLLLVHHISSE